MLLNEKAQQRCEHEWRQREARLRQQHEAATQKLPRKVELAIWGLYHRAPAPELLWALILKGHRAGPEQALANKAFQDVVRILQKRPQLWGQFAHVWNAKAQWRVAPQAIGPVPRLAYLMQEWGWKWDSW